MTKSEQLNKLFEESKVLCLAKNQGEFARLISTDQSTLSHCLHGDDKYSKTIDTLIKRAENLINVASYRQEKQTNDERRMNEGLTSEVVIRMLDEMEAQRIAKDLQIQRSQDQIDRLITMLEDRGASLHKAQ